MDHLLVFLEVLKHNDSSNLWPLFGSFLIASESSTKNVGEQFGFQKLTYTFRQWWLEWIQANVIRVFPVL